MHMPIAQMSPVFVTIVAVAAAAVIICHIWVFHLLHEMRKLNIRVIETLAESNVAIARLEQAVLASNPSASDMRATAAAVSKAMKRPGVDVKNLLSEQPPATGTSGTMD
jgi:hypothetical protein